MTTLKKRHMRTKINAFSLIQSQRSTGQVKVQPHRHPAMSGHLKALSNYFADSIKNDLCKPQSSVLQQQRKAAGSHDGKYTGSVASIRTGRSADLRDRLIGSLTSCNVRVLLVQGSTFLCWQYSVVEGKPPTLLFRPSWYDC